MFPSTARGQPFSATRPVPGGLARSSSGARTGHTYTNNAYGQVDLSGGSVDALVNAMYIGYTSDNNGGNIGRGVLTLGAGTFDVSAIYLATHYSTNGSYGSTLGTITVGNGGLLKVDSFRFGTESIHTDAEFERGRHHGCKILFEGGSPRFIASAINWNDATIKNYDAATDLTIGAGVNINLAATGSHTFDIDSGRQATVSSVIAGSSGMLDQDRRGAAHTGGRQHLRWRHRPQCGHTRSNRFARRRRHDHRRRDGGFHGKCDGRDRQRHLARPQQQWHQHSDQVPTPIAAAPW